MEKRSKIYNAVLAFLALCAHAPDPLVLSDRFVDRLAGNVEWEPDEVAEVQKIILTQLGVKDDDERAG